MLQDITPGKKLLILIIFAVVFITLFLLIMYGKTIFPAIAKWFMDLWNSVYS